MEITWYGNASIRVIAQGRSLLFDPFVPLPRACYAMSAEQFLPAPHVFITHGHVDHLHSTPTLIQLGAQEVYATSTPCATLMKYGVAQENLRVIGPGAELRFLMGDDVDGNDKFITVTVKRGKHIRFDLPLVFTTLLNPRMLRYANNAKTLFRLNKVSPENNETVVYEISDGCLRITLMGSLALSDGERYTLGSDLLILPYQGNSRLVSIALSIVEQLLPRAVLLDHFDNAFPPLSRNIDTGPFVKKMARLHPEIPVIVPQRGAVYTAPHQASRQSS